MKDTDCILEADAKTCDEAAKKETDRDLAARHVGPGFATKAELAAYLKVGPCAVAKVAEAMGLRPNGAGRYPWDAVWERVWRLDGVPPKAYERMKAPLLTDAEVARRSGISARTVRREGKRAEPLHGFPKPLDLGTRGFRHHPVRIHAWGARVDAPSWFRPRAPRTAGSSGAKLRARPRPAGGGA